VQRARRAAFPPGEAREDWTILRALSEILGVKLPYDNRAQLLAALEKDVTHFAALGETPLHADTSAATWGSIGESGVLDGGVPLRPFIADYYLTNPIARASVTMAECSREFSGAAKVAAE
jgi:NADH-quinone oxidoreductase subunit G